MQAGRGIYKYSALGVGHESGGVEVVHPVFDFAPALKKPPTHTQLSGEFSIHPHHIMDIASELVLPAFEGLKISLVEGIGHSQHKVQQRVIRGLTGKVKGAIPQRPAIEIKLIVNPLATRRKMMTAENEIDVIGELVIILAKSR